MGDTDNDGDVDLIFGKSSFFNNWANNGGLDFGQTSGGSGFNNLSGMDIGDVDGDGSLDIVTGGFFENGSSRVFLNNGSAEYSLAQTLPMIANTWASDVILGDLDGDGDLDLIVPDSAFGALTSWLNDGAGTFSDSGQSLGSSDTLSVALGDVDGDGDLDLITGVGLSSANKVWLNE